MVNKVIRELNNNLKKNIKGYKSMSLCDIKSSETLFSENLDPNFDIDLILACNLEVIKAKLYTLDVMGINDDIESIVVHLKKEVHIIDITKNKKYFIYLTIQGENIKIDHAKELLSDYKAKLNEYIKSSLAA